MSVPATNYALESLGRPLPGAGMLAGFAAITGSMKLEVCRRLMPSNSPDALLKPMQKSHALHMRLFCLRRRRSMLKQIEGSQGVAQAVALCRPDVVCAYPISPQTHIVENLGLLCRKGVLQDCEYINVESEFAAMSVAIGASVAGGRAYTATASQGLLYMAEAVYNASGLGLPVVMTVANRAIGAPINIWNDHSDSMSQRDCGWIQLFAETNQEACDLHIQAFRIAEELSIPVMVCMDGFVTDACI